MVRQVLREVLSGGLVEAAASIGVFEHVVTLEVIVDEHLLGGNVVDGEGHGVDAVLGLKTLVEILVLEVPGELRLVTANAGAPGRGRARRSRSVAP